MLPFAYLLPLLGIGTVDRQTRQLRQTICQNCPHHNHKSDTCGVCRCYLPAKTRIPDEQCPINRWGKVPR